jgi:Tfp pilus assembly ATPase PilU
VLVTGQSEGMQTLEMSLNELIADGVIDYDDAVTVSLYPKELKRPVPVEALPGATLAEPGDEPDRKRRRFASA